MNHVTYLIPCARGEHQEKRGTVAIETLRGGIFALLPTKKLKCSVRMMSQLHLMCWISAKEPLYFQKKDTFKFETQKRASE